MSCLQPAQNNGLYPPQLRTLHRVLTISLYASLLSLGVSLMVPMNTKNKPRAKDRATIVTVLGEAIFSHLACGERFPLNWMNFGRFPGEHAPGGWAYG